MVQYFGNIRDTERIHTRYNQETDTIVELYCMYSSYTQITPHFPYVCISTYHIATEYTIGDLRWVPGHVKVVVKDSQSEVLTLLGDCRRA